MISIRPAAERGRTRADWLDSRHSFSFGRYVDRAHTGFGPLRVLNEDRVAPGAGFARHGHANMEILSIVLEGALQHADSSGGGGVVSERDIQLLSAGAGVEHSERNASTTEPVRFLQVWIQPDRVNDTPRYAQRRFNDELTRDRWCPVASGHGEPEALPLRQDARVLLATLSPGAALEHAFGNGRRGWLQIADGSVELEGRDLSEGDGAAIEDARRIELAATTEARVLLFDLP